MQSNEKGPVRIHIVEKFHFQPANRSNPYGSLQVWGSRFNGIWNETFCLTVGSDELDGLIFFLVQKGHYEPATMTAAKFFDASRDIYYSHSLKCRMIADWMQDETDRETETTLAASETLPIIDSKTKEHEL